MEDVVNENYKTPVRLGVTWELTEKEQEVQKGEISVNKEKGKKNKNDMKEENGINKGNEVKSRESYDENNNKHESDSAEFSFDLDIDQFSCDHQREVGIMLCSKIV